MKNKGIRIFGLAVLATGLLLVPTCPLCVAQMGGMGGGAPGQMGGQPGGQQGAGNPNMQPNAPGMMNNLNNMQASQEGKFVGLIRRNSKAETELSKLAMKNSSNDNVKKMAQQIVTENRKTDNSLNSAAASGNNMQFNMDIPSATKKAMKQMKKSTGTQFDGIYLGQMNGYFKSDAKTAEDASSAVSSGTLQALFSRLKSQAEARQQQLAQVAQSDNFKLP